MTVSHFTREGYAKLEKQLNHLIKVRRKEIAKALEHARSFGDLHENAEYNAAKEEQVLNEQKIAELAARLSSARILDDSNIDKDRAYIGATIKIKDMESNEEFEYILVSEAEADFTENKISVTSPIGKGLLGHKENETVAIEAPAGILNYKILKISR